MCVCVVTVKQTDSLSLTAPETLLELWSKVSIIVSAGSAFLVMCLLVVVVVYGVHEKYVNVCGVQ